MQSRPNSPFQECVPVVWFNFIFMEKQTSSGLWFIVADCNLHAESGHQTPDRREGHSWELAHRAMSSSANRSACGNQYEQGYFRLETSAALSGILKYDHQFNDPTKDYFRIFCTCRFSAQKIQCLVLFFFFVSRAAHTCFIYHCTTTIYATDASGIS